MNLNSDGCAFGRIKFSNCSMPYDAKGYLFGGKKWFQSTKNLLPIERQKEAKMIGCHISVHWPSPRPHIDRSLMYWVHSIFISVHPPCLSHRARLLILVSWILVNDNFISFLLISYLAKYFDKYLYHVLLLHHIRIPIKLGRWKSSKDGRTRSSLVSGKRFKLNQTAWKT